MKIPNSFFTVIFILFAALTFLYLVKTFDLSYPLSVTNTTRSSELAIVGEGKIDVVPDTTYLDIGITINNASTVNEAKKGIDDVNNKIVAAMKNLGIDKEDIKTSNYSINPSFEYTETTQRINGYNGNATLTIKIKDMKLAPQAIDEATKAGANQVNGTRFVVDNPEKYREQVRDLAIQNAKDQAEKLADQLDIRLGKIINIVESGQNAQQIYSPLPMAADKGLGGGSTPSIEPGSQTITSTITLYFERK